MTKKVSGRRFKISLRGKTKKITKKEANLQRKAFWLFSEASVLK